MDYSDEDLNKLRSVEQEILDAVVNYCNLNNLRYSLAYGTLIGAVRHKGFIPWDDDIDLIMPRKDFEYLRNNWNSDKYYMHDFYNDINFSNNFIKIQKKHTTFFVDSPHENKNLSGIFIDIFPADRVPKGKLIKLFQFTLFAINLLFTRGYTSGSTNIVGIGERILLKLPRRIQVKLRNATEIAKRHWNNKDNGQYVNGSTIVESKVYYPAYLFDDFIELDFNEKKYKAMKCYDEFLTIMYGDYMKLPPIDEQVWGHKPSVLSFEKNYNELREETI